jgi:2,3-bisphosphoglycerate-independent phosphoglycerate mutase
MVAHTGHFRSSVRAVEVVDKALGELARMILKEKGVMVITGDHGNIEELKDPTTGEVDTEHSNNPVPFILVGNTLRHHQLRKTGRLADIAPTILHLMNTPQPKEMTGWSLLCN